MNVRSLKHQARMQEWRARISECRGSGKCVNAWCGENGINSKTYYYWEKKVIAEASQHCNALEAGNNTKLLVQIHPEQLQAEPEQLTSGIIIRYGNAVIELSGSTSIDHIAELVSALNHHA